jgi:aldose 1-epimerase
MEPIVLTDSAAGSTARVAAHLGFNCYEFQATLDGHVVDIIDAEPDFIAGGGRPSGHGIPILFPFPNRIRGSKYTSGGRQYDLSGSDAPGDAAGNAIHGFCLDRPWRVTGSGERYVVGEFQLSVDAPERQELWPADYLIEIRYLLSGSVLRADVRIANPSDTPLPWGFGTHPYFRLPLASDSDPKHCLIQAPAHEQWELIDCLPTGNRGPVGRDKDLREGAYFDQLKLDDVQTGLRADSGVLEHLIIDEHAGLQVSQRCDSVFRELVIYTPPGRNAVCLEPYTCTTDAINLAPRGIDAGWQVLEPGAEFRTWIEIEAGLVLV